MNNEELILALTVKIGELSEAVGSLQAQLRHKADIHRTHEVVAPPENTRPITPELENVLAKLRFYYKAKDLSVFVPHTIVLSASITGSESAHDLTVSDLHGWIKSERPCDDT